MRIFLTGSSSCLGSSLLPVLCNKADVTHVTGVDIRPASFQHPKFTSSIVDIRDDSLTQRMQDHDAIIHLAFVVKREGRTHQEMQDVNVRGSKLVVDAAIKNQIRKFINLSSVSVYGSGENLPETAPLNPSMTFHYAQHKADVERYIAAYIPTAIQLRSHLIIGAHAQLFLREMFRLPVWMKFGKGRTPRQQVVHEDDVVLAVMLALEADVSGAFNLSAPDVLDLAGSYIKKDRRIPGIPFRMIRYLANVMQYLKPRDEFTWVEILDTTVTVNCAKAKSLLAWEPRLNAWDARQDALNSLTERGHR